MLTQKRRDLRHIRLLESTTRNKKFKEVFGSTRCFDIQRKLMGRTFDLLDPKDWEEFLKAGGHTDKCPSVTGTAAKLAVEMILERMKSKESKV